MNKLDFESDYMRGTAAAFEKYRCDTEAQLASLKADLATLKARCEELEADRERLDWLEQTKDYTLGMPQPNDNKWWIFRDDIDGSRDVEATSLRAAIDKARAASGT